MNTESIFPVLLELLAKSAVIALVATLLLRAWRDVTAAQRHLVWFVALAIVTLLPLTRLVSPRWAIAMQPARKVTMTMPALSPIPVETVETDSAPHEAATPIAVHGPLDWRKIILSCWFTGMMAVLARRFAGSWRLRRLLARSLPLNDERVRALSERIFRELGIRRHPDLRLSTECRVPITWGVFRPRMLLPMAALEWSDTWLIAALRHESAHIRRHDYLARWVAQIACAIYWPNPFVWLLARSLRLAQEQAADDLVLRAGTPADEYATQLVDAARTVAAHGFFVRQAVAMACPSTLEHRVRAIVDERSSRRPLSMLAASLGSFSAVIVLGLCAVAQLRSEDATSPEASPSQVDREPGPIVEIEARFLNIPPEVLKADPPVQFDQPMQVFSDPQFQIIMRFLGQKPSVNLLSTPRVTTQSKQRVEVRATREFRYAKDWEKNSEGWKAKAFATKELGVTLDATPDVQADGTVALKVNAKETDLAGYEDLDHPGEIDMEHGRAEARFSQGQIEQTATLKTGETVLLTGLRQWVDGKPGFQWIDGKPRKDSERPGRLYVFVRARILQPAPKRDGQTRAPSSVQQALVDGLEDQLKFLNGLRPDQVEEALKVLGIDDATVSRNLPLLRDAMAEDARLAGQGLAEDHPRRKTLQAQEAAYRKILSDQLATLQQTQSQRVRRAKEKLLTAENPAEAAAARGSSGTEVTPAVPSPEKLTEEVASKIIIPDFELREATLRDAVAVLWLKCQEVQPGEQAVRIAVKIPSGMNTPRITLSLKNVPLIEAARDVASLSNLQVIVRPGMIVLAMPQLGGAASPGPIASAMPQSARAASPSPTASANPLITKEWKVPPNLIPAKTGGDGVEQRSAKDWLVANGVEFAGNAAAVYIPSSSRLIVRNTPDQLNRVDQIIAKKASALPPAPKADKAPAPGEEGPALTKAKKIIFPRLDLREATLPDALDFLRVRAKELDPEKTGVNLILKPGATSDARITVALVNIPLLEALHYVVSLANFEFQVQPNAILIQPSTGKTGTNDGGAQPAPISPQSANPMPREEGPALAKGRAIIIPKIEFRDATLAEALEYLHTKAKELDPEKTGVNFVVKPGVKSEARITLSLTNVPLLEAVHYVVGLADLEFQVQANAIVIQSAKAKAVTSTAEEKRSSNASTAPITDGANNDDGRTKSGTGTLMLSGINTDKGNIKGNVIVSGGITDLPGHGNAPAGTLVLDGGVLRFAEDSPQSAGAAKGTGAVESVKVKEEAAVPVEITSDSSRMENGIALAEGNAVLQWGEATMKADHIRYDPTTRQLDLTGNVEVKTGTSVQKAERMTLWLTPDGRMKTAGPHTTTLLAPPAAGPPGSATTKAGASPVAVTLAPKGTFKDNDGIEIRETTGTTSTFRVGGTYHVRGICRQSSFEHAMLLISNTADSDGEAIKPVDGTTLSREIPKGHTEFEFAFTPTRPGKLHVTIYDTDNHNPTDNAYAGIYLGEVAP